MRISIESRRPSFGAIFKVAAVTVLGYVLVCYCLCGIAALFGNLHIDDHMTYGSLVAMFVAPIVAPFILGFVLAVSGWATWLLISRFGRTTLEMHVDSFTDVVVVPEGPNQSPEPTAMSVTPPAAQEPRQP